MPSQFWLKAGTTTLVADDALSKLIFGDACPCNTKWTLYTVQCSQDSTGQSCGWGTPQAQVTLCGNLQALQDNTTYTVPAQVVLVQDEWVAYVDTVTNIMRGYYAAKGNKCCTNTAIPVDAPATLPTEDCCAYCYTVFTSTCQNSSWSDVTIHAASTCTTLADVRTSLGAAYSNIGLGAWLDSNGTAMYVSRGLHCGAGNVTCYTPEYPAKPELPCGGQQLWCWHRWESSYGGSGSGWSTPTQTTSPVCSKTNPWQDAPLQNTWYKKPAGDYIVSNTCQAYYVAKSTMCTQTSDCTTGGTPPSLPTFVCDFVCLCVWEIICNNGVWDLSSMQAFPWCIAADAVPAFDQWVFVPQNTGSWSSAYRTSNHAQWYTVVPSTPACNQSLAGSMKCSDNAYAYSQVQTNKPSVLPTFDCQGGMPCYWWATQTKAVNNYDASTGLLTFSTMGFLTPTDASGPGSVAGFQSQTGFNTAMDKFPSTVIPCSCDFTNYKYQHANKDWLLIMNSTVACTMNMQLCRASARIYISTTQDVQPAIPASPTGIYCGTAGTQSYIAATATASTTPAAAPASLYGADLPTELR